MVCQKLITLLHLLLQTKPTLVPFVVNLTKNTNATDIAIGKTINATPSNVTALQNAV